MEISTQKDVGSSRDLAKTLLIVASCPAFFPFHLKYAVQGDFVHNSSETSSHPPPSSSVSPCSATENGTVFMCLINTSFTPTVQYLYLFLTRVVYGVLSVWGVHSMCAHWLLHVQS